MIRYIASATKLSLCIVLLTIISAAQTKYSGPKQLGQFSIEGATHTDAVRMSRRLFRELGKPAKRSSDFEPYCYRSEDGKTFLRLTTEDTDPEVLDSLFLSDFPNCTHVRVKITPANLRTWHTKERIGLGSSEEKVLDVYGKPVDTIKD